MKITPCFFALLCCLTVSPILSEETANRDAGAASPLRIMPVGDSITRGTYLGSEKLPNPLGGGWRKLLQDRLRAAGVPFEFVGELDYWAYGTNGVVAPTFSPRHHGLAGFSNRGILEGGTVPTPDEILKAKGVKEIRVPGIVEALARNKPDVVLLMSGANGFNASERDLLIRTVCEHLNGRLLVASIPSQKAPRRGWEQAAAYNASLPAAVARLQQEGHRVELVDMYGALTPDDLTPDGVHPNENGLEKIAQTWFLALQRKVPGGDTAGGRPVVGRSTDAVARAVEMAHLALWSKFIGPEGLIHDYVGEIPTPEDCALGRPNAIGWWSPIENGPMFTGTYLAAYCERVKREGRPEDRERIRRLVKGLLLCASVSDVKGFIARGVGTDGKCHYPLGSQDQTHPWFYGLHAYAMSGIPDEAERKAVVDKMREVADALEALGWKCPCDGAFKGQSRGDFTNFRNHGAVMYLFNLMAMHDVTGDPAWLDRYIKARDERSPKSGKTRLEICAEGYPHDREEIKNIDQGQLWIYVSSQGALAYLARREPDGRAKSLYRAGLEINAKGALAVIGGNRNFDNADAKVFGHARWREGYPGWFEQKTQAEAEKMASTGDPAVLGKRKSYEVQHMRNPLAAAALIALAGYREGFWAVREAIGHYDYSKLNMAELFFAECAYYALPAGDAVEVGSERQLFLDDRLVDLARTRGLSRTVNPPRDARRVLTPDRPWEALGFIFYSSIVEDESGIKLYYGSYTLEDGKLQRHFCLATSRDGLVFERPSLGQKAFNGDTSNNLLSLAAIEAGVFLDPHAVADKRYRMIYSGFGLENVERSGVYTATSPNGIEWAANGTRLLPFVPDSQHTAYWDARLQRYAIYMRCWDPELKKRQVCRAEVADLDQPWPFERVSPPYQPWGKEKIPTLSREYPVALAADGDDPKNLDIYTNVMTPYPYATNAFLAFPAVYFKYVGPEWKGRALSGNDGTFEVQLATSADGVAWTRLRQPYLAPGTYDGVDLRLVSLTRGFVRRGNWLYQYFVGWPHTHGRPNTWERDPAIAAEWMARERGGIFMARQRVDGFVSLDGAYEGGVLTTRPLAFAGNRLRLNIDTRGAGCARVALLDADGAPLPGFTAEACEAINGDDADCDVHWAGGAEVGALAGRPVRVQVEMRNTKLYAMQFVKAL